MSGVLTTLIALPKKTLFAQHHPLSNKRRSIRKVGLVLLGACSMVIVALLLKSNTPCANTRTCHQPLAERVDTDAAAIFLGQTILPPHTAIGQENTVHTSSVLGETDTTQSKHIYIDLDAQALHAYQDSQLVMTSLISTGRWGWTPVGNFAIQSKFKSTRMSGGSGNDYYDLPNVPYTMFFHGDFGIHGAYWHNNFGTPMSHGCVNMRAIDAKALFEWADGPQKGTKGTAVSVCQSFIGPDTCIQDEKTHMPSPTSLPAAFAHESTERVSIDGTKILSMDVQEHPSGARTYLAFVKDAASASAQLVMSRTLDPSLHLSIPFNTWSPNNTYFFVEEKNTEGVVVNAQVVKVSGTFPSGAEMLSVADAFSEKQPKYAFERATGWASNSLLIVNTWDSELDTGPSFWFEVPSRAIMQLSQQF